MTASRAMSRSISITATPRRTQAAFAKAAHVTKLRLVHNRVVVNAMEPRAAIAAYDAKADRWTLTVCSQGVMGMRTQLAKEVLRVPPEKVRIISKNVGGSFGMKGSVYPEYVRDAACGAAHRAPREMGE